MLDDFSVRWKFLGTKFLGWNFRGQISRGRICRGRDIRIRFFSTNEILCFVFYSTRLADLFYFTFSGFVLTLLSDLQGVSQLMSCYAIWYNFKNGWVKRFKNAGNSTKNRMVQYFTWNFGQLNRWDAKSH